MPSCSKSSRTKLTCVTTRKPDTNANRQKTQEQAKRLKKGKGTDHRIYGFKHKSRYEHDHNCKIQCSVSQRLNDLCKSPTKSDKAWQNCNKVCLMLVRNLFKYWKLKVKHAQVSVTCVHGDVTLIKPLTLVFLMHAKRADALRRSWTKKVWSVSRRDCLMRKA